MSWPFHIIHNANQTMSGRPPSNWAQIVQAGLTLCLLLSAIWGYVTTVVPINQNRQLNEERINLVADIEKMRKEREAIEKTTVEAKNEANRLQVAQNEIQGRLSKANKELVDSAALLKRMQGEVEQATRGKLDAQNEMMRLEIDRKVAERSLAEIQAELSKTRLVLKVTQARLENYERIITMTTLTETLNLLKRYSFATFDLGRRRFNISTDKCYSVHSDYTKKCRSGFPDGDEIRSYSVPSGTTTIKDMIPNFIPLAQSFWLMNKNSQDHFVATMKTILSEFSGLNTATLEPDNFHQSNVAQFIKVHQEFSVFLANIEKRRPNFFRPEIRPNLKFE